MEPPIAVPTPVVPQVKNYYYIQAKPTVASIGLVAIIIVVFLFLIYKVVYININWGGEKCKNSNFFLAPLFGQDSQATFNKCASDAMVDAANKSDLNDKVKKLDEDVLSLNNKVSQLPSSGSSSASKGFTDNYNRLLSTIETIQTSLSKVIGSIVLNSYMNNGVLESTNTLQNSQLTDLIKQYNSIGKDVYEQQKATSAMASLTQ
jgi:hypothetical protein